MTAVLLILAGTIAVMAYQNRRLSSQIAALVDRQEQTEQQINRLSKTSRKQTNTARKQEQKIERLHRKQREQADRQKRIEKEQKKQAQSISKLQFKMQLAESDIAAAQDRLTSLFAILDCIKAQQEEVIPGSPADVRLARQAVVLESQIATAERKLAKARFDAQAAKEAMAA